MKRLKTYEAVSREYLDNQVLDIRIGPYSKNDLKKMFEVGDIVISNKWNSFYFRNEKAVIVKLRWEPYDGYVKFKYLNSSLRNPEHNNENVDDGGYRMLLYVDKVGHMSKEELELWLNAEKYNL